MSGIAGIVDFDFAAPDRALAESFADALEFRGPDRRGIWLGDSAALVHTLLKTTYEAHDERQPASLDGQVWIAADARIDAREDLVRELGLPQSALTRPDCELILHAYDRWGESSVDHLLGDFAFAIWDGRARKLFCARDHFGVKPFFYARSGDTLVFSNTLDCVRLHPAVTDELNEEAIADYLVFWGSQDLSTTIFRDIRRLAPAHALTATADGVSVRRYWSLPAGERIRYRRTRDYIEQFRALLESAVADRLRVGRAGIAMSGGLDSPSVAAFARKAAPGTELRAHCFLMDTFVPGGERHFAGLAADALGIPIEFVPMDDVAPYGSPRFADTPEPNGDPLGWFLADYYRRQSCDTPVVLTGQGADPLFHLSPPTSWASLRAIPPGAFALHAIRYAVDRRAVPRLRLRSALLHFLGRSPRYNHQIPAWLDADFARRSGVVERAAQASGSRVREGLRPLARAAVTDGWCWMSIFETQCDAAWLGAAVEFRHPYFDLRLVRWLMAIPELPYCMDKWLLRMALRGMLPEAVRRRPKAGLRGNPLYEGILKHGGRIAQPARTHERIHDFVDPATAHLAAPDSPGWWERADFRPIVLNAWLISQEETYRCKRIAASPFARLTTHPISECMEM